MNSRTDIHRPSVINPEEYQYVAAHYIGDPGIGAMLDLNAHCREVVGKLVAEKGAKFSRHEHGGTCHVCGANALYLAIFHHLPTNALVEVGEECAQQIENVDLSRLRRSVKDATERRAGKAKAQATLASLDLSAAWEIAEQFKQDGGDNVPALKYKTRRIINDMVNKLVQYGSVSEKQINFLRKLVSDDKNADAIIAQRAAEKVAAADCPSGRIQFSGVIVSEKLHESEWGCSIKWVVKTDAGFCIYVSAPSSAQTGDWQEGAQCFHAKGGRVELVATVEPSPTDPKFGFGKRPKLISQTPGGVPALA
jgi:hypothetical protein